MKLNELIDLDSRTVKLLRPYQLSGGIVVESVTLNVLRGSHEEELSKVMKKYTVQRTLTRLLKLITVKVNTVMELKSDALDELLANIYDDDKLLLLLAHYCFSFSEMATVNAECPACGKSLTEVIDILKLEVDDEKLNLPNSKEVTLKDGVEFDGQILVSATVHKPTNATYDFLDTENPLKMQRQLLTRITKFAGFDKLPDRLFETEMTSRDKNSLTKVIGELVGALEDSKPVTCSCEHEMRVSIPLPQFLAGE